MDTANAAKVDIYALGLVHCSVCVPGDMPKSEIEDAINLAHPTGIASRWTVDYEPFADGQANPHTCEQAETRLHYLLHC